MPSGPGAALDAAAREVSQLLERERLVHEPVIVSNRSGGAGMVAMQTLMQVPGDGHRITTLTSGMLNARAIGELTLTYVDMTPIAVLLEEAIVVAVRTDSPVRDAADLATRLRKQADGLSIGIATAVGNHIHVGVALPLQVAGVDVANLRMVPFRSSADSMTALLGGHIDVVAASSPNVLSQLEAGRIRVLAVATGERLAGRLGNIPTWTEQGIAAVYSSFQGVMGTKGIAPEVVAFWAESLGRVAGTPQWQAFVARQSWRPKLLTGAVMDAYIQREYEATRRILIDLKLAKQ